MISVWVAFSRWSRSCLHLGRINAALFENVDHTVRPLDMQVKFLKPVLVVVCPEIIFESLIDGRSLPGTCLSIRCRRSREHQHPDEAKGKKCAFHNRFWVHVFSPWFSGGCFHPNYLLLGGAYLFVKWEHYLVYQRVAKRWTNGLYLYPQSINWVIMDIAPDLAPNSLRSRHTPLFNIIPSIEIVPDMNPFFHN